MSEPANLRVYIDVNITLDLLLHRLPFYQEANQILTLARRKALVVGISAAAFPFAYFHLRKATGDAVFAQEALKKLSTLLELVSIDGEVVRAVLGVRTTTGCGGWRTASRCAGFSGRCDRDQR